MDTTVETTAPKVVKKRGGPACSDCKSKKKRCTHRGAEGETEVAPKATPAPALAFAMKTRKRQREGTIKTPASDDAPASPKKEKIEKAITKKAIKAKTTATKAKGKAIIKANLAVDEEIEGEKDSQPVKRVKRKQAANPSLADRPAPAPVADDADVDVTSTPPSSPLDASDPMLTHPTDALEGAMRMSVHTVWSQKLETRLAELKANFQAAKDATDAAIASADAVVETVEIWKAIWRKGQ